MKSTLCVSSLRAGMKIACLRGAEVWTPLQCLNRADIEIEEDMVCRVAEQAVVPSSASFVSSPAETPPPADVVGVDARGALVVPGLLDVHMHGAGGGDALWGEVEQCDRLRAAAARGGATGLVVVVPYYVWDTDFARFRAGIEALRASHAAGARILGIHLETPFINPVRRGGFPESCCHPASVALLERLVGLCDGLARVVTIAPELDGADALIEASLAHGMHVSLGHSTAGAEIARRAFARGASRLTHTYNAMNSLHHREIGLLGAALLEEDVYLELIPDGIHVHPDALRLVCRLVPSRRVVGITDANSGAGMPEGTPVKAVGGEGAVRDGAMRLADGTLAGSVLLADGAVRGLIHRAGLPPRAAVQCMTLAAAASVGLDATHGLIEAGRRADLTLLDRRNFQALATIIAGEVVWSRGGE